MRVGGVAPQGSIAKNSTSALVIGENHPSRFLSTARLLRFQISSGAKAYLVINGLKMARLPCSAMNTTASCCLIFPRIT